MPGVLYDFFLTIYLYFQFFNLPKSWKNRGPSAEIKIKRIVHFKKTVTCRNIELLKWYPYFDGFQGSKHVYLAFYFFQICIFHMRKLGGTIKKICHTYNIRVWRLSNKPKSLYLCHIWHIIGTKRFLNLYLD